MPLRLSRETAGLQAEGEIGIGSPGVLRFFYHRQKPVVVWRNCSTAVVIFFMVKGSTPWIHVTSTAIARAESAPLWDYMLQIEDIRRQERIEVLPIPISPSAIVKTSRVLSDPPNDEPELKPSREEAPQLVRSASEWLG
jgi:hypothetical protein